MLYTILQDVSISIFNFICSNTNLSVLCMQIFSSFSTSKGKSVKKNQSLGERFVCYPVKYRHIILFQTVDLKGDDDFVLEILEIHCSRKWPLLFLEGFAAWLEKHSVLLALS